MTTTATTNAATDTPARGFQGLRCVLCGAEATISLDLDDLDTFHCPECSEDFTADDVRAQIEAWGKVLAWIDSAPRG